MIKHILKNVFRNKRRSAMILLIISLSMALMFLTYSYLQAMYWGLRAEAQQSVGQLQIATDAYWADASGARAVMTAKELSAVEGYLRRDTHVSTYNVELGFDGLIGDSNGSTIANGIGIVPGSKEGVASGVMVLKGHPLFAHQLQRGLVGTDVAKTLDATPGSWLSIMAQTVSGEYNAISFQVAGVVTTGSSEADKYFVALPIDLSRELVGTRGADHILVFFSDNPSGSTLEQTQNHWNELFRSKHLALLARNWKELSPYYFQLKALYDVIFSFLIVVIVLLVCLSVFEIVSMAFYERTRELGTLRAIGNTKGEIFALLLGEVTLLYLIGLGIGLGVGLLGGSVVNSLDITWFPPGASAPVPFLFFLQARFALLPAVILFAATVVAGIAPALRTARLDVAEVLRYE